MMMMVMVWKLVSSLDIFFYVSQIRCDQRSEDEGWRTLKSTYCRLKKTRLKWFGHVKRRDENSILRRTMELEVEGRKSRGKPKKALNLNLRKVRR